MVSKNTQRPDRRKPNTRALLSATGDRNDKAEHSVDIKRLDLRLPATREILHDDTLRKEEDSLRVHLFPEASERKKSERPLGTRPDAGYNVAVLKSLVRRTASDASSGASAQVGKNAADADKDWHEINERVLTPEEERDARVIENRAFLDPKRFYKSSGTGRKKGELPTRVHFGTVVVGPHEFYSARLTRKERKPRIIDEVLADRRVVTYAKQRSAALQNLARFSRRIVDPAIGKRRKRR